MIRRPVDGKHPHHPDYNVDLRCPSCLSTGDEAHSYGRQLVVGDDAQQ